MSDTLLILLALGFGAFLLYRNQSTGTSSSSAPNAAALQAQALQILAAQGPVGYAAFLQQAQANLCPTSDPALVAYRAFLDQLSASGQVALSFDDPRILAYKANYEKTSSNCVNAMSDIDQQYIASGKLAPFNPANVPLSNPVGMTGWRYR